MHDKLFTIGIFLLEMLVGSQTMLTFAVLKKKERKKRKNNNT
jgi:hypothetical protein